MDTPTARAARLLAHAIFAAGEAEDADTVAYVGLSNKQLIELLNEGEVRADRWGSTRHYAYVIAGHPAVNQLREAMPDTEIGEQTTKFQFDSARDDAWGRSVVELMETGRPALRNDDFLRFLNQLRMEVGPRRWKDPTLRQIAEAVSLADLPKARVKQYGGLRTLAQMLEVPWEYASTQSGTANPEFTEAFRGLPRDAGVVLALGAIALDKLIWDDDFSELRQISLDDIVGIEATGSTEFNFLDGLKP